MSDLVERLERRSKEIERLLDIIGRQQSEIEHLDGIIKTAMGGKRAFEDRITLIKEIERLRADLQFSYENKAASDDTWRKECERLRAALEYYASGIAGRGDIARHMLKDKP